MFVDLFYDKIGIIFRVSGFCGEGFVFSLGIIFEVRIFIDVMICFAMKCLFEYILAFLDVENGIGITDFSRVISLGFRMP